MPEPSQSTPLESQHVPQQQEAVRMHALQQVLGAFAPGTLPSPVGYRVLLQRVHTLLTEALASTPPPVEPAPLPTEPAQDEMAEAPDQPQG
jgi:hypothetical protein